MGSNPTRINAAFHTALYGYYTNILTFLDDNITQDLFHSDDDENDGNAEEEVMMESEESQWRMMRLERQEYFDSKPGDGNTE